MSPVDMFVVVERKYLTCFVVHKDWPIFVDLR
jgi:hypothetical protein